MIALLSVGHLARYMTLARADLEKHAPLVSNASGRTYWIVVNVQPYGERSREADACCAATSRHFLYNKG